MEREEKIERKNLGSTERGVGGSLPGRTWPSKGETTPKDRISSFCLRGSKEGRAIVDRKGKSYARCGMSAILRSGKQRSQGERMPIKLDATWVDGEEEGRSRQQGKLYCPSLGEFRVCGSSGRVRLERKDKKRGA